MCCLLCCEFSRDKSLFQYNRVLETPVDVWWVGKWTLCLLFSFFTCILSSEFRGGVHVSIIHWFGEGFELGLLWICCTPGHSKPVSFMWVRCLKMRLKYWGLQWICALSCFSWACSSLFVRQLWPREMTCVCVSVGADSPGQEYKVRKAAFKIILNVARF